MRKASCIIAGVVCEFSFRVTGNMNDMDRLPEESHPVMERSLGLRLPEFPLCGVIWKIQHRRSIQQSVIKRVKLPYKNNACE